MTRPPADGVNNIGCLQDLLTVVILAGGQGNRLGGQDKGLMKWQGRPLIDHVLDELSSVTDNIMINANRNLQEYGRYGYRVFSDRVTGFAGPLAGMHAALTHAETPYVLTLPCDSPTFSAKLVARFCQVHEQRQELLYVARSSQQLQPVYAMLHRSLLDDLTQYLSAGKRKTREWLLDHGAHVIDFEDSEPLFRNINVESDWQQFDS